MLNVSKVKNNAKSYLPLYTLGAGVVIGTVATGYAVKPKMITAAAWGYILAMTDARTMASMGVDIADTVYSLEDAKLLVWQQFN